MSNGNVWEHHAAQWNLIASPLRPCSEDIEAMQKLLGGDGGCGGIGLLLGVTPELLALSDKLIAVDYSSQMVANIWRPRKAGHRVHIADWRYMAQSLPATAFNFALGDGCLNVIPAADYASVFAQLELLLKPGSLFVLRLFSSPPPDAQEEVGAVIAAAHSGYIGYFNTFKWRLAMAVVAGRTTPDVCVDDIWEAFRRAVPDQQLFSDQTGWAMTEIATINAYQHSSNVYSFPTFDEFTRLLPARWQVEAVVYGAYELAERCPVLALRYA